MSGFVGFTAGLEFGDAVLGEIDIRYVQPYHQGPAQITKPGAAASTPPPNPVLMRSLFVHLYNRAVSGVCRVLVQHAVYDEGREGGCRASFD